MSQSEAWSFALLGLGVLYACGGITVICVRLFGKAVQRAETPAEAVRPAAPLGNAAARPDVVSAEPVPDDVLAVICAVLEVESKLYLGPAVSKLTIRRKASQY
jgi:hypothetical protein